ncbi:carbohydrate ABC transporter permease [Fodinicola feengrottensis]|uniref:carbohydrate ABC transporter permease n=1 Tax=Fodinicola feengrottensis TaxID=435914 RepID=UPI0024426976|nr:sugar ABC transporter permease [Fodinicola feengrottensis]
MTTEQVAAPAVRPPVRGRSSGGRQPKGDLWLLVLPALVPILLLSVVPLVQGMALGFTDSKLGLGATTRFTGLDNFGRLWGNDLFWNSFRIGVIWAVAVTGLQFLLAMGLSLLLNENLRLRWLVCTLALTPWAMPPVIIAITWKLLLDPTVGPVSSTLSAAGLVDGSVNLLGDFRYALPAVIAVGVWVGMPQTTITLLAGLQSIPASLHEAAAVDGAGAVRRFFSVTLPQLRPVIVAITALDVIWNFNSFALVYVLTAGGPGGQTMLPMLFAYNEAFRYGQFGYASAMGDVMVVLVVIVIVLIVYLRSTLRGTK